MATTYRLNPSYIQCNTQTTTECATPPFKNSISNKLQCLQNSIDELEGSINSILRNISSVLNNANLAQRENPPTPPANSLLGEQLQISINKINYLNQLINANILALDLE